MRSDIELLRIISAFGIVWFHSGFVLGRDIAYGGLIVFLIFSSYFAIASKTQHALTTRAARLLVPCFLWSMLYAVLNLVRGQSLVPEAYSFIHVILATPSIHLWYLPYIFFVLVLIDWAKHYLLTRQSAVFVAVLATLLLISAPYWRQWQLSAPFGQYLHALPAILIGVLLAQYKRLNKIQARVCLAMIAIAIAYLCYINLPGVALSYLLGFLACLLLLSPASVLPHWPFIFWLSRLSFGIYLSHVFIIFLLLYLGFSGFLLVFCSFIASAFCVFGLTKTLPKSLLKFII